MSLGKYIEEVVAFGLEKQMIEKLDVVQVRNELLCLLKVSEPYEGEVNIDGAKGPFTILEPMLDEAAKVGLIENNTTERDILDAKIMATLMPRQSELNRKFQEIKENEGIEKATEFYYDISKNSNYIRMDRISKNQYWTSESTYGELEITINLSKPEKDPKEIEKAKSMPQSNYPKCFLCLENVGYEGRFNHPARSNHRVLPIELNNEQFYLQYSPYAYYNEHAIIFKEEHEPMSITGLTFKRLLDFIEQVPHYMIGSNADLPIVGGSILSHEHYQGGRHTFPMAKATSLKQFTSDKYPTVKVDLLKWPMSVMRLSSTNKEDMIALGDEVLKAWREYTDEEVGVLAYSMYNGENTPHNTITPIARTNAKGEYELDLVLRNNRRNDEHPDGIFHPHVQYHNIKKENIGLIEVMGLAILPARLKDELAEIESFIADQKEMSEFPENLTVHKEWVEQLEASGIQETPKVDLRKAIEVEVGKVFLGVLECCGVFKQDEAGLGQFEKFITKVI